MELYDKIIKELDKTKVILGALDCHCTHFDYVLNYICKKYGESKTTAWNIADKVCRTLKFKA